MDKKSVMKEVLSWVVIIPIAALIAVFITRVLIIKTEIISGSMIPEMQVGDKVVGNRLAYLFKNPQRGDIVFFEYPDDESRIFVKRIIGVPGDTIVIEDGFVYLNGSETPIEEPYVFHPDEDSFGPFEVPENCYFMMGDNRIVSNDSRKWVTTYVTRDEILGKAVFRFWPSFAMIDHATYD